MSETTHEPQTERIPPWTLGWRMQRALSWAGITTEQMADELGVSRSTVSRWLNDRGTPSRGYVKLWALRCGVPHEWLAHGIVPAEVVHELRHYPTSATHYATNDPHLSVDPFDLSVEPGAPLTTREARSAFRRMVPLRHGFGPVPIRSQKVTKP